MKKNSLCTLSFILFLCSAPMKNIPGPQYMPPVYDTLKADRTPDTQIKYPAPLQLSVEEWVGQLFIVLKKQSPFSQYGYELYTCKELDACKNSIDTAYELANHRIRCDRLSGHQLEAVACEPSDTEYIVSFKDKETEKMVYGKTHKKSIKEIVSVNDTAYARMRWLNKVVFSRKGVISTVLEGKNGFGSLKVLVQDSLKVIDILVGTTPLPVHPVWLAVKTKTGQQGIIPLRVSWTNAMNDKIKDADAWTEELMESDPSTVYSWDATMWELINNHRIVNEMTKEQVLLSWGEPLMKHFRSYNGVQAECWEYGGQNLYFSEKMLLGIENK